MLLADYIDILSRAPQPFLVTILGALILLAIYITGVRAIAVTRDVFGRKPPVNDDLADLDHRVDSLERVIPTLATRESLDAKFRDLDAKRSLDTGELHKHVERVNKALNDRISDTTESLNQSIMAMPGRVIEMLRNSGAIGR